MKKYIYIEARRMSPDGELSFNHVPVMAADAAEAYDQGWIEINALNNRQKAAREPHKHYEGTFENDYVIEVAVEA